MNSSSIAHGCLFQHVIFAYFMILGMKDEKKQLDEISRKLKDSLVKAVVVFPGLPVVVVCVCATFLVFEHGLQFCATILLFKIY